MQKKYTEKAFYFYQSIALRIPPATTIAVLALTRRLKTVPAMRIARMDAAF